jgi:hypothetical protein
MAASFGPVLIRPLRTVARAVAVLGALATLAVPRSAAAQGAIAVIVNRSNPVKNVSASDLQRLYLGATTVFPNREHVLLLEQANLRDSFYRTVLMMSEDRVKRYWIGVVFSGSGATPPKSVDEAAVVLDFVRHGRGAIAFVDAQVVDSTVKVLAVEGSRPGDPDYALFALPEP